jgi:hypothetical protein
MFHWGTKIAAANMSLCIAVLLILIIQAAVSGTK